MTLIEVIVGSTRDERFSERAAAWTVDRLSARDDMKIELVDLRDHPLPFFDGRAPAHTKRDYPTPEAARFGQTIDRADGFVIVTPEYNHGYPAVLKNAIDHTFVEWHRKPVSFVSWGNVGGARVVEQLRLVAVEMEMAPLRHAVHILPDVLVPALRAPEPFDLALLDPLEARLKLLADDLAWWATALTAARGD
ncbi:MAG TPA: NAD(P)H-dependent oxidoreductase [Acidimicrobiales bacterium]|nr:NAD(P)H-dependent oxidoreductase [Acidimicrobiales bacterium]